MKWNYKPRSAGLFLLAALVAVLAIAIAYGQASPAEARAGMSMSHMGHAMKPPTAMNGQPAIGTTEGWYEGSTVTFFYNRNFFCANPPSSGAPSGCEAGEDGTIDPRPGPIPVLYVMTPIGFRPAESTLQCPVVGNCINHPSTIDLSRVFGTGFEDVPLPAHSHIIDVRHGGWWELEVIGVTDPAVWDQVVAGKSLDTVRALQAQGHGITQDIPTNTYLFFQVQGGE